QQKQLEETHYELIEKNEEVLASIRYAQTIQSAMLPSFKSLQENIKNFFLIFKPKDIVSGDFYWFKKLDDGFLLAVADCTGHGVPGSMISMMGSSILDEAVLSQGLRDTGRILTYLNSKMIEGLNKRDSSSENRDGMDICLIRIIYSDTSEVGLQFSGAKRPLYLLNDSELNTIRGDRNSIAGEKHLDTDFDFSTNKSLLKAGSKLFLTSDGFVDQMGEEGKKYGTKRLKQLLGVNRSFDNIQEELEAEFTSHIGLEDQRDDVTILGIEV
ncbi:SpoIIE family protein phosphatase, partial [Candidatus Kapabacteria bacterium]|nr:SpoIIE family protein phosphatase [Candidatus Kapabacteria bacterium]